jgi:hypothetical protein
MRWTSKRAVGTTMTRKKTRKKRTSGVKRNPA